jgi:type IV fimbrial biogenesis protein FimT
MPHKHSRNGFTLVEAAVVTTLTAIVASLAAPGFQGALALRRLDGAATELAANLQLARSEAVARNRAVRLSWHAVQRCYVVHTGAVDQCVCSDDGSASCSGDALLLKSVAWDAADVALQSNTASMLFDPLHGTASPTATWRVSAADGRAVHHVVNVMGRVRSCSPLAAVPGLRAC